MLLEIVNNITVKKLNFSFFSNFCCFFKLCKMDQKKFCFNDYDCIGFDLDCTLAEYNVKEIFHLVYDLLAEFLVQKKFYKSELLLKPVDEGFLQKGLFMDLKRGNILKISKNGFILKASHGTNFLSDDEIIKFYGTNRTFDVVQEFVCNPLSIFNTPSENILRSTLDCFDMSCTLLFARVIDSIDKANRRISYNYNVWPDILEGLYYIFDKDKFFSGKGGFYEALKKNPYKYYKKWNIEKLSWLSELKKKKFTYLLTGSFVEFASFTASYCLGENWKEYFDVIICNARKPYFFMEDRPFSDAENEFVNEVQQLNEIELKPFRIYNRGNWKHLIKFMSKQVNVDKPKCVYIGDNMIQDILSPWQFKCCDTVAVSLELKDDFGISKMWGNYLESNEEATTYWHYLIKNCAKLCIPDVNIFLSKPLTYEYTLPSSF